jgi:serine protease Do
MNKRSFTISLTTIISVLVLSACGTISFGYGNKTGAPVQASNSLPAATVALPAQAGVSSSNTQTQPVAAPVTAQPTPAAVAVPAPVQNELLAAYEGALETIYAQVSPSVVSIQVVESASASGSGSPFGGSGVSQALGSGFVYDAQGHIITNNHVVSGATSIEVTFSDGTTVPAKVVGTDPYSDLAVIQVSAPANLLHPVTMADSNLVKVGELVVAIGNPFGLSNTMTSGIVSALGRSLPATDGNTTGPTYSIPDIIQTDAPINPGNSGGVLLNDLGQVVGVTAAIESSSNSSSGIGFVIPSNIVQRVAPDLIKTGTHAHPYLGISATSLDPDLAKAMGLNSIQQGAMVADVTAGGPADKAGLKGSTQPATIAGQSVNVGGDVITAIDGQPVKSIDDVIAYLENNTQVGQKVTLTILRGGKEQTLTVTLGERPAQSSSQPSTLTNPSTNPSGSPYFGISVVALDSVINQAMNLPANQKGLLIEQVQPNGPADQAGLQAGTNTIDDNGNQVLVGGDVIVAINNQAVTSETAIQQFLSQAQPGQRVTLTIIRNGTQQQVRVRLGSQ